MKLYHGSTVEVKEPSTSFANRALDFGAGFYLTSSRDQAERWARTVARRRRNGTAVVSVFEFDKKTVGENNGLSVLTFPRANEEWLEFVVANRQLSYTDKVYDIVIGPVANDSTIDVINRYMSGEYTRSIAIQLLEPQNLTDQYAFLTEKAVGCLAFEGSVAL